MNHVTASTTPATAQLLASNFTSLMHGWIPTTIQVITVVVLTLAVGWRSRRWRTIWLPVAGMVGGAAAYLTHWYIVDRGLSDEPAPSALWLWIALTGVAAAVLVLGWRGAGAQPLGRLLPDRAGGVEPAHLRPPPRSDRPGHRHRDGRQTGPTTARQRGTGGDPVGRVAFQAPR